MIGRKKRRQTRKGPNYPIFHSVKTNKQKREKETIQSNAPKRQKSIENNRTEANRTEAKEKLLKKPTNKPNQTIHLIELN